MNKKIGMVSSVVNAAAVLGFAVCMMIGSDYGSYFVCMFIAFSFVPMTASFCTYCTDDKRSAGYSAMIFGSIYAVLILIVYFAQVSSVRNDSLGTAALQILDYQKFGLLFNYDLLGYGLMALSTFFIGLTIEGKTRADKWLKGLLLIHGVFFFSCLIMPMLGIFNSEMGDSKWVGTLVLMFWCVYFTPISVLSYIHFSRK